MSMRSISFLAVLSLSFLSGSCGYHMRGAERPFFERNEIKTLYILPVKNNAFKPGVEITVYNALRKEFAKGGYVRIVDDPALASAKLEAAVNEASFKPQATTTAEQLAGSFKGP